MGFRGQLEGSPERHIALAGTVHGGSHMRRRGSIGRACLWHGNNRSDIPGYAMVAVQVRECQRHDARMRLDDAPIGAASSVTRLAIMPRRRASDRRTRGRDATGGKTGGGYAAAFPSLAKLGFGRRKPEGFCSTKHSLPAATSRRHYRFQIFFRILLFAFKAAL